MIIYSQKDDCISYAAEIHNDKIYYPVTVYSGHTEKSSLNAAI